MNNRAMELFKDEEFLKKVLVMSPEDAQKEFEKEGGEITVDELNDIAAKINKALQSNGELDEESLDDVVGGAFNYVKFGVGVAVGIAVVCAPW